MTAPPEGFASNLDFDLALRAMSEPPSQLTLAMLYEVMGPRSGELPALAADDVADRLLMVEACRFPSPVHYPNGDMHAGTITTHELDEQAGIVTRRHEIWWLTGRGYELRPVDVPLGWLGYTDFDVQRLARHLSAGRHGNR